MNAILYEQKGNIGIITIDREPALNALNVEILHELEKVLDHVDLDQVRCMVITGAGSRSFVAGADIKEMLELDSRQAFEMSLLGNRVFRKIEIFPVPVIAAVGGYALGAGCELAMSCDFRLASENASFAQPEAGLGITPGYGGTQRLARLVGTEKAKELIFTGRRINAQQAKEIGLVSYVYPQQTLMEKAMELALEIAGNAPFAVRMCKASINEGIEQAMDRAIETEAKKFALCFNTMDMREAMRAFVEKRKPRPFENK